MHQTCDNTPIVDAYVNLKLSEMEADNDTKAESTTLFIQYKHSKLMAKGKVKVSEMNREVQKLGDYLKDKSSKWNGRPWIFLWVTNWEIVKDADPDPNLLWVGRDKLIDHAPLIGRRGLVPMETERSE